MSGRTIKEVEENGRAAMAKGYRHIRVQVGIPGMATYGARAARGPANREAGGPTDPRNVWEPGPYLRTLPKLFEHLRSTLGDDIELLHDVHERISPSQAVSLCKELEKYHPFFIEDPLPPEEKDHFHLIRQQSSVPIAMGELFNTQQEYVPLIAGRLIDFIRIHISQIGGLSAARKVAALCEFFGVKTAWHGPSDCFAGRRTPPSSRSSWPATTSASTKAPFSRPRPAPSSPAPPRRRTATCTPTRPRALGIDIDEKLAAKYPVSDDPPFDFRWGTTRRRDGTVIRP